MLSGTTLMEFGGVCTSFGASVGIGSAFNVIVAPLGVLLGAGEAEPDASGDGDGVGVGLGDGVGVAFPLCFGVALGAGVGSGRLKLNVQPKPSALGGHAKPLCASAI
jgi:hypothetical protein